MILIITIHSHPEHSHFKLYSLNSNKLLVIIDTIRKNNVRYKIKTI